jgi:alpha-beta hydrolase superfamily lysophospholipase
MTLMSDWIGQRLKKISQSEFTQNASHRMPKLKKNLTVTQEYYAVPLSAGCGTAILTSPKHTQSNELGPLVLFFHGLEADSTTPFWHWINEFVSNGISVLSVDWDGHGIGGSSLFDIQECTRSIPLIINRLYGEKNGVGLNQERLGPKCYLMGHSFGASLTLIAVTREDIHKLVQGVIVVSPILSVQPFLKMSKEWLCYLNPSAWMKDFFNKFGFYGIRGFFPPSILRRKKHFPMRKKVHINIHEQARHFSHEIFENRKILQKVKTPVLWFHGMKDNVCPYYQACHFMMEIKSAFFSFCDNSRGHFRMIYHDQVTISSIKFILNNQSFYQKNQKG